MRENGPYPDGKFASVKMAYQRDLLNKSSFFILLSKLTSSSL